MLICFNFNYNFPATNKPVHNMSTLQHNMSFAITDKPCGKNDGKTITRTTNDFFYIYRSVKFQTLFQMSESAHARVFATQYEWTTE